MADRKTARKSPRRDLKDLANRITLRLFHPYNEQPFADRLVLMVENGQDLGGWALTSARAVIYDELRKRPRKTIRRRRRG